MTEPKRPTIIDAICDCLQVLQDLPPDDRKIVVHGLEQLHNWAPKVLGCKGPQRADPDVVQNIRMNYEPTAPDADRLMAGFIRMQCDSERRCQAYETTDPIPAVGSAMIYRGEQWEYGGPDNDACTSHRLVHADGRQVWVETVELLEITP